MTLFERDDRIGGLLYYGIPDFKLERAQIDRRMQQMEAEGVTFRTDVVVGDKTVPTGITSDAHETITAEDILKQLDAMVLTGGSEVPRNLPVSDRDLNGVHYALEFLIPQNKEVTGNAPDSIRVDDKYIIVIGSGNMGSDCVSTSNRHGVASVTQFELLPRPPEEKSRPLVWPYWPIKLRISSSHDEGCQCDQSIATKAPTGENGRVTGLITVCLEQGNGKIVEVTGNEFTLKANLALLAMGFTNPIGGLLDAFGVTRDVCNNVRTTTESDNAYTTNVPKVSATGGVRRGQSLIVWAIREGYQATRSVDAFLMGYSDLPR